MIKHHLNALKERSGMSLAELAADSRVPEATIRKILSGETKNPSFDTVVQLVIAMGGNVSELVTGVCPDSGAAPSNSTETPKNGEGTPNHHCRGLTGDCHMISALTATYESRIEDVKHGFEERLINARALKDAHIADLRNDKKMLGIALATVLAFLLIMIVLDLSIGNRGWVQY